MTENLYEVLGVSRGAEADEIKKAYRRKAVSEHPDKGGDKEKFQKIQEAYDVLSEPEKRSMYDATGQIPNENGPQGGGHGVHVNMADLFGGMFGGIPGMQFMHGMPGMPGMQQPQKQPQGPHKLHEIGVSLSDLYHGKTVELRMKRECLCAPCGGKGGTRVESCGLCGGKGIRMSLRQMGPMTMMAQEPCNACQQTGTRVVEPCKSCSGRKIIEQENRLNARIEPGMQEADRIVFPGQCSESPMFEKPGDVILVIRESAHGEWKRKGSELSAEVKLTMAESMCGWSRVLNDHPSGKSLHVVWNKGALREGQELVIPEWGMPVRGGSKGPLRVICRIESIQKAWSEEQLRALKSVWPEWTEPEIQEKSVVI